MAGPESGIDFGSRLHTAAVALGSERFDEAYRDLRFLAERCESGEAGSEAVLLLASQELNPRNPDRSPQAAAQLAARYLQISSASPTSLRVAESLYLLALDLGANPVESPFASIPASDPGAADDRAGRDPDPEEAESAASWSVASGFRDCDVLARPRVERPPPRLAGRSLREQLTGLTTEQEVLVRRIEFLESELRWMRDPMGEGEASLYAHLAHLASERDALRSRLESLESELERIRGLIRSTPQDPDSDSGNR